MQILVEGSGGSSGWPQPGCRCASCLRQAAAGNAREQSTIVVDEIVRIGIGDAGAGRGDGDAGGGDAGGAGYRVVRVADREAGGAGGLGPDDAGRGAAAVSGRAGGGAGAAGGDGALSTWRSSTCWAIPPSLAGCGLAG